MWILLLLTVHFISATKVYYVVPTHNVRCPSQPCATLNQYLQFNSTLSFVSDVEYRFLPGQHKVNSNLLIHHVNKFSLTGSAKSLTLLQCQYGVYISVQFSSNVTITGVAITRCGNIAKASLFLWNCAHCSIINVHFNPRQQQYSVVGINVMGEHHLDRITININTFKSKICGKGILLMHHESVNANYNVNNTVIISNFVVNAHSTCLSYGDDFDTKGILLNIRFWQFQYAINIIIHNFLVKQVFIDDQPIVYVSISNCSSSHMLFENCTFVGIQSNQDKKSKIDESAIKIEIGDNKMSIRFVWCTFNSNQLHYSYRAALIGISFEHQNLIGSSIIVDRCNFSQNHGILLTVYSYYRRDTVLFNHVDFLNNNAYNQPMITIKSANVYINGTVNIFYNVAKSMLLFLSCRIVISGKVNFSFNSCTALVGLRLSLPTSRETVDLFSNKYIEVEEYTSIMFNENRLDQFIITAEQNEYYQYYKKPYSFCLFQYITSNSISNIPPSTDHYNITITQNNILPILLYGTTFYNTMPIYYLTAHCKWIPTAAYYGHHPGSVNKKIIDITGDERSLDTHSRICLCSSNGKSNCSLDVMGTVYPGQVLQASMAIQGTYEMSNVYTETHAVSLPESACRVTTETDHGLITALLGVECRSLDFTIVSNASKECELFLTTQPDIHYFYDAFYVEILACPPGFVSLYGVCDCDPLLINSVLHIEACDINRATVKRPANSWIFCFFLSNKAKYLFITNCPMDYCLPESSALNLSNPDVQCQFNRSGILCSQCQHELSMVFGSSRCKKCTNVHILITLIVIVAGIVLVLLLYLLNLTITNGTINGIIFYANIVSINDSVFLVNDNVFNLLKCLSLSST